jgi:hypothetical protein
MPLILARRAKQNHPASGPLQTERGIHESFIAQSLAPAHGPESQDGIGCATQWFKQGLGSLGGFQPGSEDQIRGIPQIWKGLLKECPIPITLVANRLLVLQPMGRQEGGEACGPTDPQIQA